MSESERKLLELRVVQALCDGAVRIVELAAQGWPVFICSALVQDEVKGELYALGCTIDENGRLGWPPDPEA